MIKLIAKFLWRLWGWKLEGATDPYSVKKGVLIVIPHTSNWDFPIGILNRPIMSAPYIAFVAKASLFKFPFGGLMKALGGVPVNRKKSENFVTAVVRKIKETNPLVVCIAPEGTRSKPDRLKTGFYYMAQRAEVPLIMVAFDWKKKIVRYREPYELTGDWKKDYTEMAKFYEGVEGYNPELQYRFDVSTVEERYPRMFKK